MPIRLTCPRCNKPLQVDDRYAGRPILCPGCRSTVTATTPAITPQAAGDEFDFYVQPAAAGAGAQRIAGPDAAAWQSLRGALGNVWLGSGLQVLAVTVVYLVAAIVFNAGARMATQKASPFADDEPAGAAPGIADRGVDLAVLGTLLAGTLIRLVGFFRALSTPAESGAKGLAVAMLACELMLLTAVGASAAGVLLLDPLILLAGLGAAGMAALAGLLVQLFFLNQIGSALHSKLLPAKLWNFVWWLIGGAVAAVAIIGTNLGLNAVLGAGALSRVFAFMPCIGTLLVIGVLVGAALTVLIKYLGLLTVASDEIRKRVGKVARA
jgi:hypothetical protein